MLYQAIAINVIGFLARAKLVMKLGVITVSSFFFLTPIFTIFMSVWILGEGFDKSLITTAFIVVAGLILAHMRNLNHSISD